MNSFTRAAMFDKELRYEGHVKRFSIQDRGLEGWEVREEQDHRVVRQVRYNDWHRVERAMQSFSSQVGDLEASGWRPSRAD